MLTRIIVLALVLLTTIDLSAQEGKIYGKVFSEENETLAYAEVQIAALSIGTITDEDGAFVLDRIPYGTHEVLCAYLGHKEEKRNITISATMPEVKMDIYLSPSLLIDEVVVTGTKTFQRKTDSPVIVNVLNSKTLDNVQACNLSEGLKFQPGLRVETDCQTCNYTQLRMNGLAGGYSQILINGRPIFSPLTGLYGMEQLPVNMIDRIEVVRGGGSSLYGSSAIGGTVNVITKIPKRNNYEINYNYQSINGKASDHQILGNATVVSPNKNAGISFFMNNRQRDFYDHDGDNYSEIPLIKNTSIGINTFFLPRNNHKLEVSFSKLYEYRIGGEMVLDKPAYLTKQSEERTHDVYMASADYQINFNEDNSSAIVYAAWQQTDRNHYTGIFPDEEDEIKAHIAQPPYGTSDVQTYNVGLQLNHRLQNFLGGSNVLTLGSEYVYDKVYDVIPTYRYKVDQTTGDFGLFLQSDWKILQDLTLLSGVRMDVHNLVENPVVSPRFSLLYKAIENTQIRLNYGTGFRAPQAFDSDLHIAFAGGGISRISLSPDLKPETSHSYSGSVNYDLPTEDYIIGGTVEGFYTRLNDAFYQHPIGEDQYGERFEKRNGQGATVQGATVEVRANYNRKIQLEGGYTVQSSRYDNPVAYIDGVDGIKEFIRTPKHYGFGTLSLTPSKRLNANINYLYTGSMKIPHFQSDANPVKDHISSTPKFHEWSAKLGYVIPINNLGSEVELYGGVKNLFNAYQDDFDTGKNRDSNYVYGPAQPRTFIFGLKMRYK